MPNPNINRRTLLAPSLDYDPDYPKKLANLGSWWKADSLALNDGDAISTWTDSNLSNNATGVTTTRPLYKANIFGTKPVVRFDGTDDILTLTSTLTLDLTSKFTMFVCLNPTAAAGSILLGQNFGGANGWSFHGVTAGSIVATLHNSSAQDFQSDNFSTTPGNAYMAVARYNTTVTFRENKTSRGDRGISASNFDFTLMGRFAVVTALFFNGDVAEIIIYNGFKTDAECDAMYDLYMKRKYRNLPIL